MGQEVSIPNSKDAVPNVNVTASPQAAASPSHASTSNSSHTTNVNSNGENASQQPQARKKPPINGYNSSGPSTGSIMSRSGLSSMIQRMGTSNSVGGGKVRVKKMNVRGDGDAGGNATSSTGSSSATTQHASSAQHAASSTTASSSAASPGTAVDNLVSKMTALTTQQPSDEDDWEKAWAEDSESDEEEESTPKAAASAPVSTGAAPNSLRLDALSPLARDLDGGHSSMGVGIDLGQDLIMEGRVMQQQQQQQQQHHQQQQQTSRELPEISRALPEIKQEPTQEEEDHEEDWEGYHHEIEAEKPCVEMFDPALRVLGRGSFGRVVLVQKRYGHAQGGLYAMKILRKSHLVRRRQIERTKTERKVLSVLNHPFIMRLYYAFQTQEKLYLVLDYCPGGELFFHLSRYRRFQEPVARFYAAELLLAIGHLHKHGIIYRDLKPENVLLDAYGHVKLGDFGLAKDGIRHPTQGAKSTCGTPEYMAPEVLNQTGHGFCVDYWGLGMILYEMMTGLPPWYTTDRSKLFRRLRSAPLIFPNEVPFSPHCKACIAGLLERDPRLRLGVLGLRSAMRHEFFYRRINFEALRNCQISAPIRPCEGWRQFANKQSNGEGSEANSASLRGHSAGPSFESAAMGQITMELLDVATENFDDTFRRMPIETEDYEKQQQAAGHAPITEKELNEQTFRGFTFDGDELMDEDARQEQWQKQQEHYNHQLQQQQQQQLYYPQQLQNQIPQQQQQQQQNQHGQKPDRGEMT